MWLDFVEHMYLPREDWIGGAAVADTLEAAVRAAEPTAVFAPFGLGNPDHDATHDAAMLVRERLPEPGWFLYEDMGYKHIPGLLAWRVARLFVAGIWPTPAALPVRARRRAQTARGRLLSVAIARARGRLADLGEARGAGAGAVLATRAAARGMGAPRDRGGCRILLSVA